MRKAAAFFVCILLTAAFTHGSIAAEKKSASLPAGYDQKLKKIADFFASELINRGIKTVSVKRFTDPKGRVTNESGIMTDEFVRRLSEGRKNLTVVKDADAEAVITGALTPFKGREKWKLQIKAANNTGGIITAYEAYFKKTKK
jgi:hypothetical protein